jgi:hypothetical protein
MKKRTKEHHSAPKRTRAFRAGVFACIVLAVGAATAIANFASRSSSTPRASQSAAPAQANNSSQSAGNFVTVEVAGKKLRVNAQTLQQGPLTQEQSQQIVDALKNNKSTDGLVEVQHPDGSVSVDLQGRFRDVVIAKRNNDGSISTACVDTPEAASAFLQGSETTTTTATRPNGKAALQQ